MYSQTWRNLRWEPHHSLRPWNFMSLLRKVVWNIRFVIVGYRSAFYSFLIRGKMGGRYLKRFQGRCCRHKASVFLNILGPAKWFLLQWNISKLLSFSWAESPFIDVYPHKKSSLDGLRVECSISQDELGSEILLVLAPAISYPMDWHLFCC